MNFKKLADYSTLVYKNTCDPYSDPPIRRDEYVKMTGTFSTSK